MASQGTGSLAVAIRADASEDIGSGHVIRCLTLAERIRSMGADVLFICRAHKGSLTSHIAERGFTCAELPLEGTTEPADGFESWVGNTQSGDAQQTIAAVNEHFNRVIDWMVVDHYGLDAAWETAVLGVAQRVFAIDDLADRTHNCDLLLDQNDLAKADLRYEGKVPERALVLLGPRYALLQPDYRRLQPMAAARRSPPQHFLVYFGGGPTGRLAAMATRAILARAQEQTTISVVLSRSDPLFEDISKLAAENTNVHLYDRLPSLAEAMLAADFSIGAAGATSWERVCLKLGSLVVILAENQRGIAGQLEKLGMVHILGEAADVTENTIGDTVAALANSSQSGPQTSVFDAVFIDGFGCDRLGVAMMAPKWLRPREATAEDSALLLGWANDPQTRANSFTQAPIPLADHERWLATYLSDNQDKKLYIVEAGSASDRLAIGQIRFDRKQSRWVLNYALSPVYRGLGLAERLLAAGIAELRRVEPDAVIEAHVFLHNEVSVRAIRKVGFQLHGQSDGVATFLG